MEKQAPASRCPYCGSQSIEFLDKRRPAPAKVEQQRWRCLSSRCGRHFKSIQRAHHVSRTRTGKAA